MPHDLQPLLIDPIEHRGVIISRCPVSSHGKGNGDRNRSLRTRRGKKAWLVKCWAGCELAEICAAIGLKVSDLFDDGPLPRGSRPAPKPARVDRRQIAFRLELHGIHLQYRADAVMQAAGGLDTSRWSDTDFDVAMCAVTRAYDDVRHAEILFAVADSQRETAYMEGR